MPNCQSRSKNLRIRSRKKVKLEVLEICEHSSFLIILKRRNYASSRVFPNFKP